ncbi:hypothetical protein KBH77_02505 [Patescibacteria group bacterium]|nr:hypothetical protein [Patescibacteria group bacterium]
MIKGFIKNTKLLEETSKVPDSMEWLDIRKTILQKVSTIRKSSMIAIIGPFGSGKSTMLDKIEKEISNNKNFWFNFEAWKYPERENLWENFIYDFAISSKVITKEDVFKIIHGELRGGKKIIKRILMLLTSIAKLDYVGTLFTENLKEYPVTRINDYQKLLDTVVYKLNKPIFITIEDIDRSGDYGIFFLETLKNYLAKTSFKKRILFLIPINTKNYNEEIEGYLKIIDYFQFFNPPYVNFLKFVDDYLRDDLKTPNNHLVLAEFLSQYFIQHPDFTLRKLKLILRQANIIYKNQLSDDKHPDWRLTLCAEIMKFTPITTDSNITYYESISIHKGLPTNNIFSAYIEAIRKNSSTILDTEKELLQPYYKILTIPKNPNTQAEDYISVPWVGKSGYPRMNEDAIYLEDFYFKYN